ncbi:MAG: hypothetical protein JWN40_2415 [Phycisphaerales bacterium]|nr:hypothetical protein [Phycisphaerales bacterium]
MRCLRSSLSRKCFAIALVCLSCAPPKAAPPVKPLAKPDVGTLQSLHVRLTVNPADGSVVYFGWYDGRRNILGTGGIVAAMVGMEPPDLRGEFKRLSDAELLFEGIDQNQIVWLKRFQLDDRTVSVTYRITNRRDEPFDAIVYSLSDLPDATITGDNRDQYIQTPIARARFHAAIDNPNFPGEQMNPFALRSDSRRLEPGASMEFKMTWELQLPRQP